MRLTMVLSVVAAVMFYSGWISEGQTSMPAAQKTFTKEIAPGQSVVVTSEQVDPNRLGVLGTNIAQRDGLVTVLRVDLHTQGSPSILLGATGHSEYRDFRQGFDVLDVFLGDAELVVACVMGSDIGLWRITFDRLGYPDGWTLTPPDQRIAVRTPLKPAELSVMMSPVAERRWHLAITHGQRTVEFEQVSDAWRFKQVNPPWPRPDRLKNE